MENRKEKKEKTAKKEKIASKTDTSKVYELSYILASNISNDDLASEVAFIQDLVSKNGGDYISGENPVMIDLAYPMLKTTPTFRGKFTKGYFGWMKFEIEPESLSEIKKTLDLSSKVVRFLLVKTIRENTLLNGKMSLKNDVSKSLSTESELENTSEEIPSMNLEEVDKSIDDLVIA